MVEETKYDDAIECHHSYDKRCHKTYTTDYVPQQVENCDENFVKECHIEYKNVAFNETVDICNQRPVRDCDQEGEIVCETVYESECETTYHIHEVEDDTPECETQYVIIDYLPSFPLQIIKIRMIITDGEMQGCHSRIFNQERMRQMAPTSLQVEEGKSQEIFSRDSGTLLSLTFKGVVRKRKHE